LIWRDLSYKLQLGRAKVGGDGKLKAAMLGRAALGPGLDHVGAMRALSLHVHDACVRRAPYSHDSERSTLDGIIFELQLDADSLPRLAYVL
jgi:hypothetical protein